MLFPDKRFDTVESYLDAYKSQIDAAYASVPRDTLTAACQLIQEAYQQEATLFVCGNGGSAAIANHFACDHGKGVRGDTDLTPRVVSLVSNTALLTALANDLSYDDVFAYQLEGQARSGDVLVTISSSGDSENIVRATRWGNENGLKTIAFTGFEGGRSHAEAQLSLHVEAHNYGVIEDLHQSLMQIIAQFIRQLHIDASKLGSTKF